MPHSQNHRFILDVMEKEKSYLSAIKAEVLLGEAPTNNWYYRKIFSGSKLLWKLNVRHTDTYRVRIGYYAREKGNNFLLEGPGGQKFPFTLDPIQAYQSQKVPMRDPSMEQAITDVELVDLNASIHLEAGVQEISLEIHPSSEVWVFYLELLPLRCEAEIQAKEALAIAQRTPIKPYADAGYGLFITWAHLTTPRFGPPLPYNEAIEAFDTDAFARQAKACGASYVIFTAFWIHKLFPDRRFMAPLPEWLKYACNTASSRDLIADLITSLEKVNIKLFLYINTSLACPFQTDDGTRISDYHCTQADMDKKYLSRYQDWLEEFLGGLGRRYGKSIHGFWLDSWGSTVHTYGVDGAERVYKACKIGNPDRLVSLAFSRSPCCTPWQDYACGEFRVIGQLPEEGMYKSGHSKGIPYHTILILDDDWIHMKEDTPIEDPQYTPEQLATFLNGCREKGGMVSISVAVYQDGSFAPASLETMKKVKDLTHHD